MIRSLSRFTLRLPGLAAIILAAAIPASGAAPTPAPAPVSAAVIADAADGQAHFLVMLKDQASLETPDLAGRAGTGRRQAAYTALRQAAQRSQPALARLLEEQGAAYRPYWLVNMIAVQGGMEVIESLSRSPLVSRIDSNLPFRVVLPQPDLQASPLSPAAVEWNITRIGAPQVWAMGFTGQDIVYASGDTGVMWNHPALINQYRGWNGAAADHNYNWWDPVEGDLGVSGDGWIDCDAAPCDDYGHGTHVMGTGVGSDGNANQVGVAPGARWIACRNMENGWGTPEMYIACLQFFLAPTDLNGVNANPGLGADVVSNSYGCPAVEGCPSPALEAAVDAMRAAGIFMAVSAGNDGPGCSTIHDPPGIYDSSFSVGATNSSDGIAPFSSRGPAGSLLKPDLVAPGAGIRSSLYSGGYGSMDGTSMAAPHVAGAVALLWSARPELRGLVDETEEILRRSALPLAASTCPTTPTPVTPNNVYGAGRLNVLTAVKLQITFVPLVVR